MSERGFLCILCHKFFPILPGSYETGSKLKLYLIFCLVGKALGKTNNLIFAEIMHSLNQSEEKYFEFC